MSNGAQNFIAGLLFYFASAGLIGIWIGMVINMIKFVSF